MTLEELSAIEAIKQVKARYCHHIDLKEWDDYADLFTREAMLDTDRSVSTRGRDPNPQPQVKAGPRSAGSSPNCSIRQIRCTRCIRRSSNSIRRTVRK